MRNFGIIAHIDAGKTTTTERVLYFTGVITKIGEVHDGKATMDSMDQERERGITIASAATKCSWTYEGIRYDFNIIDTPGHVDFTIEVERSLRVLDGAICVFDGVEGVQTQTMTVWKQADKYNVPRIVFINKLDRIGANFYHSVDTIVDKLQAIPLVLQIPVGSESNLTGVIDLVKKEYIEFDKENKTYTIKAIPNDMIDKTNEYREKLLNTLFSYIENEEIIMRYMENPNDFTDKEIVSYIRELTIKCKLFPVFCGSAYKNVGVQPLLDGVVNYLPSPEDIGFVSGKNDKNEQVHMKLTDEENFSGLIFKIMKDKFAGKLSFLRIYSGTLKQGDMLYLPRINQTIRIGRFVQMHSNHRNEISEAKSGDIIALIGDFPFITGETICTKNSPILLESIKFPEPVISFSLIPKTREDRDKLINALQDRVKEDPSFSFSSEDNELKISGMGELHLDVITTIFKNDYKINFEIGEPEVAYKETFTGMKDIHYEHKKQSGGRGQYAIVDIKFENIDINSGFEFVDQIVGGAIPSSYIPNVKEGIANAAKKGPLVGAIVVGYKAVLYDGRYHDVDSSNLSFELAGYGAFKEMISQVKTTLLEPIMLVEIEPVSPENYGSVTGLLSMKRGRIKEIIDMKGGDQKIVGYVPLSETFNFIGDLRQRTQGQSSFSMSFDKYEIVPEYIIPEIRKKRGLTS